MREKKDCRLFFALWPDDELRREIVAVCSVIDLKESRARFMRAMNIHMTLHFIGNVSFAERDCLGHEAAKLRGRPFRLTIDCQGYFEKPRVLWLGCAEPPRALFDLQRNLGQLLLPCGFSPEDRPFNPHVSIARNLRREPAPIVFNGLDWRVDSFVLVESRSDTEGVEYRVIDEFALV